MWSQAASATVGTESPKRGLGSCAVVRRPEHKQIPKPTIIARPAMRPAAGRSCGKSVRERNGFTSAGELDNRSFNNQPDLERTSVFGVIE
jgi:hypothetical protein